MGALHADAVGLMWADVAASARNLARGMSNEHLENPLAISAAELIERVEQAEARRAKHRREAEWRDAEDTREVEFAKLALREHLEAVKRYAETGEIGHRLVPACDRAIKAEINASRVVALKAAAPEIGTFKEAAKETGWQFSANRVSGPCIAITYKMPVSVLAAQPRLLNESDFRQNIRTAMKRLESPTFDRRSVALVAAAMIEQALKVGAEQTALRPSRWYPTNALPHETEQSVAALVGQALSRHQPLPKSEVAMVSNDETPALPARLPTSLDPQRARSWGRWRSEVKSLERKGDFAGLHRLLNSGPDPPN